MFTLYLKEVPTFRTFCFFNLQPVRLVLTCKNCSSAQTMSIERNRTKIAIESIENNRTQSNNCDLIAERNRNSIEYYPGFAVRLLNVIESIEYYGKFQF